MRHLKGYHQLFESQQELTQEQKDWLDECARDYWDWGKKFIWKVNHQTGLVDVEGDFYCYSQGLTDFKGVRFGNVSGNFNCSNNKLKSLKDGPKHVGEDFDCHGNKLTSLKDAPKHVGGVFSCYDNELTSLEGAHQHVGRSLICSNNPISKEVIEAVLKRMTSKKIPLEVAVEELWDELSEEDQVYLAKHNPDLTPEEKRIYRAIELNRKRR